MQVYEVYAIKVRRMSTHYRPFVWGAFYTDRRGVEKEIDCRTAQTQNEAWLAAIKAIKAHQAKTEDNTP